MAIALVAHGSALSTDGNGFTSGAIDTTGANFLIVSRVSIGGGTVTDSKSNTWTPLSENPNALGDRFQRFYYCENATVGSGHTFSVSGTGNFPSIFFAAYSGVATSSSFDVENTDPNGVLGNTVPTGSVTPGVNNELLVAALQFDDTTTPSIDGGFTVLDSITDGSFGHINGSIADLVQTSAAAANPSWSWTNAVRCIGAIATFKAAAGATPFDWLRQPNDLLRGKKTPSSQQSLAWSGFTPPLSFGWFKDWTPPQSLSKRRTAAFQDAVIPSRIIPAAVDWFSALSLPRILSKPRPSDFPAFTMPSQIIVPTIWLQEFYRPLPRQRRPEGGYVNPSYQIIAATIAIDWFTALSEPRRSKIGVVDSLIQGWSGFTPISVGWFSPFSVPVRRKAIPDLLSFNAWSSFTPVTQAVLDWFEALSDPKRFSLNREVTSQSFFAPTRAIAQDIVTVDKWFLNLSMPVRLHIFSVALQQALAMVKSAPFAESVSIDRWLQGLSIPSKLSLDGLAAASQPFTTIDPVTPVTPPTPGGDFTVSGRSVEDLFPTLGVNYTYAPITRRTN